jgi:hypothetical protein
VSSIDGGRQKGRLPPLTAQLLFRLKLPITISMHPELPSEVLLYIFAFLPLPSVASVHLVCSNWHHLIDSHANFVYRSIYLSGLPTPSFLLDAPDSLSSIVKSKTWLRGTTSWRELARRVRVLARNWSEANAEGQWLFLPSNDVWRMVYDPVEGSVVCSTRRGNVLFLRTGPVCKRRGKRRTRGRRC